MTNEEEQAIEKLKGFKYFLDQSGIPIGVYKTEERAKAERGRK